MMTRKERYSIIAGLFGNGLEWYDFLLYASFAPIFAELFFPTKFILSHYWQLLAFSL